jgi:hypothetical protein
MDLLHLHLKKLIETITQDHAQQQVKYLQHLQHLQQQQQLQLQQIQQHNLNSLHVPLTPSSTTNALANPNNVSTSAVNASGVSSVNPLNSNIINNNNNNTSNANNINNNNSTNFNSIGPAGSPINENFPSFTNSNAGTPVTPVALPANTNLLKTQTYTNSLTNVNAELNTRDNFIINQHQQQLLTITNAINSYVQQQQQQNLLIIKLEELINTLIQVNLTFLFNFENVRKLTLSICY